MMICQKLARQAVPTSNSVYCSRKKVTRISYYCKKSASGSRLDYHYENHPDHVEFFQTHRNRLADVFPLEMHFLPELAQKVKSVLDIGCGGGGFYEIWSHFNPVIFYCGVDQSSKLIQHARKKYGSRAFFLHGDILNPILNEADPAYLKTLEIFDLVVSLGVLPVNREWPKLLDCMWKLTGKYCFFDVRVSENAWHGFQEVTLDSGKQWDGVTVTPYEVITYQDLYQALAALEPHPSFIQQVGYWRPKSKTSHGVPAEFFIQNIVLKKGE